MMVDSPNVFICHSSEDKEIFVENFANNLFKKGIDAWVDKYEIKFGESIVEKVNEGLKNSDKGVIIFSKNLNNSLFAMAEVDSLIYKGIYEKSYFVIPIIIDDDVEIPELINHISGVKINNVEDYDKELDRICDIIFGRYELSVLGEPPSYYNLNQIPNCTKQDTEIFRKMGDYCLGNGFEAELDFVLLDIGREYLVNIHDKTSIDQEEIEDVLVDTLDVLEEHGYIKSYGANVGLPFVSKGFTSKGFYFYFKNFVDDSNKICKDVISAIYNDGKFEVNEIVSCCSISLNLLHALIRLFKEKEFIICDNKYNILEITSEGKRQFNYLLNA